MGVSGRAESVGLVRHELSEEIRGAGAGVPNGRNHLGDFRAGIRAEWEGVAVQENLELGGKGGKRGIEGFIPGQLALDLVESALGGLDLTEDASYVLGDDGEVLLVENVGGGELWRVGEGV